MAQIPPLPDIIHKYQRSAMSQFDQIIMKECIERIAFLLNIPFSLATNVFNYYYYKKWNNLNLSPKDLCDLIIGEIYHNNIIYESQFYIR